MSLMKCKECGKEVSTLAKTCPNCGAPVEKEQIQEISPDSEQYTVDPATAENIQKEPKSMLRLRYAIIGSVIFIAVILLISAGMNHAENEKELQKDLDNLKQSEKQSSSSEEYNDDSLSTDSSNEDKEDLKMTTSQKNAYETAKSYLDSAPFSKFGLIDQLSSSAADNYPRRDAEFAVKLLEKRKEVNWKEQACKCAERYLDTMSFSKQELIDQLSSEAADKFTHDQAVYAVKKVYK